MYKPGEVFQPKAFPKMTYFDRSFDEDSTYEEELQEALVVRCMLQGYQTLMLNDYCLYHQIDDTDSKDINVKGHIYHTNKYGPLRYYYQYRNAFYCKEKFHGSAYEFIWDEVLNGLDKASRLEEQQSEKISEILRQAKEDYANHVMGKYRARGMDS